MIVARRLRGQEHRETVEEAATRATTRDDVIVAREGLQSRSARPVRCAATRGLRPAQPVPLRSTMNGHFYVGDVGQATGRRSAPKPVRWRAHELRLAGLRGLRPTPAGHDAERPRRSPRAHRRLQPLGRPVGHRELRLPRQHPEVATRFVLSRTSTAVASGGSFPQRDARAQPHEHSEHGLQRSSRQGDQLRGRRRATAARSTSSLRTPSCASSRSSSAAGKEPTERARDSTHRRKASARDRGILPPAALAFPRSPTSPGQSGRRRGA